MKRIPRGRPFALEDALLHRAIQDQVVDEVPELIARHEEQMAGVDSAAGTEIGEERPTGNANSRADFS
jgi:hypothetical protein